MGGKWGRATLSFGGDHPPHSLPVEPSLHRRCCTQQSHSRCTQNVPHRHCTQQRSSQTLHTATFSQTLHTATFLTDVAHSNVPHRRCTQQRSSQTLHTATFLTDVAYRTFLTDIAHSNVPHRHCTQQRSHRRYTQQRSSQTLHTATFLTDVAHSNVLTDVAHSNVLYSRYLQVILLRSTAFATLTACVRFLLYVSCTVCLQVILIWTAACDAVTVSIIDCCRVSTFARASSSDVTLDIFSHSSQEIGRSHLCTMRTCWCSFVHCTKC